MSVIANHHSLNLALGGEHFARVEFPALLGEDEVKRRATRIMDALCEDSGKGAGEWDFRLTRVLCHGEEVSI